MIRRPNSLSREMILYNNRNFCFLFTSRLGSVIFTRLVLVPALLSTVLCGLLLATPDTCLCSDIVLPDTTNTGYSLIGVDG